MTINNLHIGEQVRRNDGAYFDGSFGYNIGFIQRIEFTPTGALATVKVGHNDHESVAVHCEYLQARIERNF